MKPVVLFLVYAVLLIGGLIGFAPLEAALSSAPATVTAQAVSGTVWNGRLQGVRVADVEVGDVEVGVAPAPLLLGRFRAKAVTTGTLTGEAVVEARSTGWGLSQATLTAPLSALGFSKAVAGEIALRDVTALFANGVCVAAEGQGSARIGGQNRVTLAGRPRCEGENWILEMRRVDGADLSALRWSLAPDGRYSAQLRVAAADAMEGQALAQAGFSAGQNGYLITAQGRLR